MALAEIEKYSELLNQIHSQFGYSDMDRLTKLEVEMNATVFEFKDTKGTHTLTRVAGENLVGESIMDNLGAFMNNGTIQVTSHRFLLSNRVNSRDHIYLPLSEAEATEVEKMIETVGSLKDRLPKDVDLSEAVQRHKFCNALTEALTTKPQLKGKTRKI